jgi:hypothetical protein
MNQEIEASPLIQTKLHRPRLTGDLIERSHLLARLDACHHRPLTLVSAPAGYGKTTLVKKALITPLRERWVAKIGDGPDLDVQGNILDHEYKISAGRQKVAEVSKRWFRVRDTYGVEIEPGQNDIVIL